MRALTLALSASLLIASSAFTTGQAQMMQRGQPGFQHPAFRGDARFFHRDRDHDFFRDRFFFHDRFRDRFAFSFGFPGPFFPPVYAPAYYYPPPYYCGAPYYPPCPYVPY
jgi:hypothetical protein